MGNRYFVIPAFILAGLVLGLMAACSQPSIHQATVIDTGKLPPPETALAYLEKYPDLAANRQGVLCSKYENVIEGISNETRFFKYEDVYIHTAGVKVAGEEQARQCLTIGALPYKNDSFMVGNHRNMREFFNLNRLAPEVWFRYFAVYECSKAGEEIDQETVLAFLSLGAKMVNESSLGRR